MTATPRIPIYLDHHATTPVDPRVLEAMLPWFTEKFGNAASVNHPFGWEAAEGVETGREQVARLLNVSPKSIVFTSGATEANNLALKGVMRAAPPESHLIVAAAEHRSVLDPAKKLRRAGYAVTVLPVDEYGRTDPQQVAEAIRPETALVSVMAANNEVGTLNPIDEIGRICRERGVLFHTDAVQAAGKLPFDLGRLPVDLASLTAHKLYGPKGIGALYVRRGGSQHRASVSLARTSETLVLRKVRLEPLIDGGGHEGRLRSGTLPVPLIVGFGAACELASRLRDDESARLRALRDRLWDGLSAALDGLVLNGHPDERLPGNLNVSFEGVDGEALMMGLKDVAVSSGSACTSADPEPSHVLTAMGRNNALTRASLRFGLGRFNTPEEIDHAISVVSDVVRRLRERSV